MIEQDVLSLLLHRREWERYGPQFTPDFFEGDSHRFLFNIFGDYWGKVAGSVSQIEPEVLRTLVADRTVKSDQEHRIQRAAEALYAVKLEAVEPVVREALIQWRARRVLLTAMESLDDRTFDPATAAAEFESLAQAVNGSDVILSPLLDAQTIIAQERKGVTFSTGLLELDSQLVGGLWGSEVGLIIAPAFGGKSWALTHLGATALREGHPVIHFTCENSLRRVSVRYYQNLLGWPRLDVIQNSKEVSRQINDLCLPDWSILDYSSSGVRTGRLRHEAREFARRAEAPPLIVVDHLDLETVKPNDARLEGRFALTAAMEELRQIASELECGLWTAVQANREGFRSNHIRMDNAAESLGPVRKADVVVTINQNRDEEQFGAMTLFVAKARERIISHPGVPVKAVREFQRLEDV